VHSSLNIIWVIKPREMRSAGHVARLGEITDAYRVLVWKSDCDYLVVTGAAGRVTLKWILRQVEWGTRTGSMWLRTNTGGGLL
jgi:hypothetical protein